jgi:hypothetical protein
MASLADKKKALDWSNRNAQGFQGILDVNQFLPVTGDIQSGVMAAQDLQKGNYGSAALNSLGLLPFVPALGGITAFHGSPYKFDKFDLLNAKKGSGVNLFGKGIYLTDNPNVAKSYAGENGYLYKVDLPDNQLEKMIPYMQPIKNQSEKVKGLANKYNSELQKIMELQNLKNPNEQVLNVEDLYTSDLFRAMGKLNKEAEPKLIEEGIPGVHYQNIGGNAKNYTVYDPSILKILERNGLLLP